MVLEGKQMVDWDTSLLVHPPPDLNTAHVNELIAVRWIHHMPGDMSMSWARGLSLCNETEASSMNPNIQFYGFPCVSFPN